MILCDSNVWLALVISLHFHHTPARDWLATVRSPASVLFCRATQHAFLRLRIEAFIRSLDRSRSHRPAIPGPETSPPHRRIPRLALARLPKTTRRAVPRQPVRVEREAGAGGLHRDYRVASPADPKLP